MGGRFGKYGDLKRRRVLQRSRREQNRLTRWDKTTKPRRKGPQRPKTSEIQPR